MNTAQTIDQNSQPANSLPLSEMYFEGHRFNSSHPSIMTALNLDTDRADCLPIQLHLRQVTRQPIAQLPRLKTGASSNQEKAGPSTATAKLTESEATQAPTASASINLWELLFGGRGANPARPVLMAALGLDADSADFLAASVYWRLTMESPFYKFNAPNGHSAYREGDSWLEELGMSEHIFYRARATVATKNVTGNDLNQTLESTDTDTLVIYWTDDRRQTWYDVKLDLLASKLGQALGMAIIAGVAATLSHKVTLAAEPVVSTEQPPAPAVPTEATVDNSAPTAANPELLMKPQNLGVSYSQPNKEEIIDTEIVDNSVRELAAALTERGVFAQPAHELAAMARANGLSTAEALVIFDKHKSTLSRYRSNEEECIAMTVARLRKSGYKARRAKKKAANPMAERFKARIEKSESTEPLLKPPPSELDTMWREIQTELEGALGRAIYDLHLRGGRLVEVAEGKCVIEVASESSQAWLTHRLKPQIQRIVAYQIPEVEDIAFTARVG